MVPLSIKSKVIVETKLSMTLIATVWRVHSRSMLILTLSDLWGPTGGGSEGTYGGSHIEHSNQPTTCRGQILLYI